jgi:hypothetical protein
MKPINWRDVNPRAFSTPRVSLVDFGHADGRPRFCIVGTDYGFMHNTGGDVRTWRSYSGAQKVCRAYCEARE